jgi:hypothetical protein
MSITHILARKGGIAALILFVQFAVTGCVTLDPEQQRAAFEKEVKTALQQTDVQMIRPYAVASTKYGYVPVDGKFSGWGWPSSTYFGDKLIAQVQLVDGGLTGKIMITGSINTGEIRSVSRAQSSDGYDAVILNMDDNIRYYIIPFGAANVTPFGEIKDYVAFTKENDKYQNAQCVDLLLAKIAAISNPRPLEAGLQLIDKTSNEFVRSPKVVEGILEKGSNRFEIDGKAIALHFEHRQIRQPPKSVLGALVGELASDLTAPLQPWTPMLGYSNGRGGQVMLQELKPSKVTFVVDGVPYVGTFVYAKDGSWRYRVQLPEPVL